jgi:hypothetical protein
MIDVWGLDKLGGEMFTGVSGIISVAHDSPEGARHGHDYEIKAWYRRGSDARDLLGRLDIVLDDLDHNVLPEELRDGERLAQYVGYQLPGCIQVEVKRKTRRGGISAKWVKE